MRSSTDILIRIPDALDDALRTLAAADGVSRAAIITRALRQYTEAREAGGAVLTAVDVTPPPVEQWPIMDKPTICGPCTHLNRGESTAEQHCGNAWSAETANKDQHIRNYWHCVCPTCRPASEPSLDAPDAAGEPDDQPATPEPPPPPNAANGHAALVMASQDERSAAAEPEPIAEDAPATPGPEPETVAAKEPPEPPAAAYTLDYSAQSAVRTLFDELSSDREIHPSEAGIRRRLHTDALKRAHTALTRREGSVLRNALRERETWTEPTMSGQQAWLLRCIEEWLGVLDPDQA